MEMQNRPGGDALINGRLADELELTSEQKEELKERAEKLEKELEEKIAQLKKKARAELLEGLTSKQREKLDDLLGDSFEYEAPKFGNRIRQIRDRAKERAADKE